MMKRLIKEWSFPHSYIYLANIDRKDTSGKVFNGSLGRTGYTMQGFRMTWDVSLCKVMSWNLYDEKDVYWTLIEEQDWGWVICWCFGFFFFGGELKNPKDGWSSTQHSNTIQISKHKFWTIMSTRWCYCEVWRTEEALILQNWMPLPRTERGLMFLFCKKVVVLKLIDSHFQVNPLGILYVPCRYIDKYNLTLWRIILEVAQVGLSEAQVTAQVSG